MGRSQKPLRILTCYSLEWGEFEELKGQGHVVEQMLALSSYDLVLAPNAHRMNEDLRKYLPLALAEGRRVKYPKSPKENDGTPKS